MNKLPITATKWRYTSTGPEACIAGIWYSVNGNEADGVQDIRFCSPNQDIITIETETRNVEANGWVESGPYHTAMFHPQPEGIRGCPMGRSQISMADAIADLARRTNDESGTTYTSHSFTVTRHDRQPV